jgi:2-polyprenyl-6-methoxyphenol hydroxylase-like FAD-dependent oxidoreductase
MISQQGKRRAVVIGGSMSGLFTAAFLRQVGWQAEVYERSSVVLVGRGAGITTHPELLAALEASGAGTKNLGVIVDKRIALDRKGMSSPKSPSLRFSRRGIGCKDCCAKPFNRRIIIWAMNSSG